MLSFPIESVRAVIARGRGDAEVNGGYRNPHYGLDPGRDEQPGLWLVGDHGVYLCSNGKLPDGESLSSLMRSNAIPAPTTTGSRSSAGRSGEMTASNSSMPCNWRP